LIETDDIVATLGAGKKSQWLVGFALETEDRRLRALAKLERKHCDLMVLNGASAMNSLDNDVEIIDPAGSVVEAVSGSKEHVAERIFAVIQQRLIDR
jgi:phosphopantothenoylcysteine decarboxylase/phosphopantothenate--cysteine ligase